MGFRGLLCFGFLGVLLGISGSFSFADQKNQQLASWDDWREARELYDAGKYQDAITAFKAHPSNDPAYFYNLGSAYLKQGNLGQSVAFLEKAQRLSPFDSDIRHNVEIARTALAHVVGEDHLDSASNWLETLGEQLPVSELRLTLGVLSLLFSLFWLRGIKSAFSWKLALSHPMGILVMSATALNLGLLVAQHASASHPAAVVVDKTVIRSGPGDQYMDLSHADPGIKLRLLGQSTAVPKSQEDPQSQETWHQVRFNSDGIGWIRASSLLLL